MRLVTLIVLSLALSIGGCAGDGSEYGEEAGGTWGTGPWELPPQVKRSFAEKYPGATVAAWDRHNFEGGESVYDIVYHDQSGQSHSVRLSALGEELPQTAPEQSQNPAEVQVEEAAGGGADE